MRYGFSFLVAKRNEAYVLDTAFVGVGQRYLEITIRVRINDQRIENSSMNRILSGLVTAFNLIGSYHEYVYCRFSESSDLRSLYWAFRRWSLRHCWYRLRLPFRRAKWAKRNWSVTRCLVKSMAAHSTTGSAIVFGEFKGKHGLGRGAAYDLKMIRGLHEDVFMVDITDALRGVEQRVNISNTVFENAYFLCQPDTYWIIPRLIAPEAIADAWRIGRWAWETPLFPNAWQFAETLVHEVWAASEFCAVTFESALTVPVRVVPYPVTAPVQNDVDMRARLGIAEDAFVGLSIMDIYSCPARKNPWGHVLAWRAAFGSDLNCILVMKIRFSKRSAIVLQELRDLIGHSKNIIFYTDELDDVEIAALHGMADVYISLHRSEGFGLNILEALLLGKQVVATHYSANVEYGSNFSNYWGVPFRLIPYHDWLSHYSGRFKYADPDVMLAGKIVRDIKNSSRADNGGV